MSYRHLTNTYQSNKMNMNNTCKFCNTDLNSGMQCEACYHWFHDDCFGDESSICSSCSFQQKMERKKQEKLEEVRKTLELERKRQEILERQRQKTARPPPRGVSGTIYLRVSTQFQNDSVHTGGSGLQTQYDNIITGFLYGNGNRVAGYVSETGSAFRTSKNPNLQNLVDTIAPGSLIVVDSCDRFSRNVRQCSNMLEVLHQKDCLVWSVRQQIYSDNPEFINQVHIGQQYSEELGAKVASGLAFKSKAGSFMKRTPFGYIKVKKVIGEGETAFSISRLKKCSCEQTILRQIFNEKKKAPKSRVPGGDRETISKISGKYFRKYQNSTIGKKLTSTVLKQILACPSYDSYCERYEEYLIDNEEDDSSTMFNALDEIEEEETKEDYYIMKCIVDIKFVDGMYKFLIVWDDGKNSRTYEPVDTICEDAKEMVEEFLNERLTDGKYGRMDEVIAAKLGKKNEYLL